MLDLDLGGFGDSTWLIEPLTSEGIRVLVVTGSSNRLRIATALEQGAIGYQLKSAGFDALVSRVQQAITAESVLDPAERTQMLHELSVARIERSRRLEPFGRLTDRERLTLQALAQGRTVHEIAREWQLSEATVRTHVRSVLAKLKAPSQLAAVSIALRSGWLDSSAQQNGSSLPQPSRRATDAFAG
jgi:DNA-binding NarL/FixJ family response regulator